MKSNILIGILLFSYATIAFTSELPESFKNYQRIVLLPDKAEFFIPKGIKVSKKYEIVNDSINGNIKKEIARFSISKIKFKISFDAGPSQDPVYMVNAIVGNKEHSAHIDGDKMFISWSGSIFSDLRSNQHYDKKRKFNVTENGIFEAGQPFYYVGYKCELTSALTITSEMCGDGNVIAQIPKGGNVEVLLHKKPSPASNTCTGTKKMPFLVKTSFGLVGWAETKSGYFSEPGEPLSCIRYFGD